MTVALRPVLPSDLDAFYANQADAEAAAVAGVPSRDRAAFDAHWARMLAEPDGPLRTVLVDGAVAGNLVSWRDGGRRLVGYWLGREWWGRGVATAALRLYLAELTERPLHALVSHRNAASARVLEKCGFLPVSRDEIGVSYELPVAVTLRTYGPDDLALLERGNAPELMTFLGGPETPEAVRARHERYASMPPEVGNQRVVLVGGEPAGFLAWWPREWRGEGVYEIGWKVLPEFGGRGVATAATRAGLAEARGDGRHRYVHAFPRTDNAASNAVCRRVGFTLLGECDFEYPKGFPIVSNDWRYDLA
ncbi:MAG TPA: GNAT family N-acetyltransferase [Mycobacteriales bacterium]|nr:GNAT family N-acetyltransferase [Mycobacteriales bacterium]